jgi:hypothetical protein
LIKSQDMSVVQKLELNGLKVLLSVTIQSDTGLTVSSAELWTRFKLIGVSK